MNTMKEKKAEGGLWDIAITVTYFFISFYGLRKAIEEYLFVDDLSFGYSMLLGLVSGIIMSLMILLMKNKTMMMKIIGVVLLLLIVVGVNSLIE